MGHGINLHTNDGIIAQTPGVGIHLAGGATVPADGTVGYAPGCFFFQTDGASLTTYTYINVGTRESCNFDPCALPVNVLATPAEINNVADRSENVIVHTTSTLSLTEALHHNKTVVLDLAAGIEVTLPAAAAGLNFELIVKTTFTGAAAVKSATGADIMFGHAIMGNNSDNTVVNWQAVVGSTIDTVDMFGTANSTGGMAGQRMRFKGIAANLWYVEIIGDAAGTEATPFANTVT